MLDAVEHRGERFTIVRRGRVVAQLEPVITGKGRDVKALLEQHPADRDYDHDLALVRHLLEIEDRS